MAHYCLHKLHMLPSEFDALPTREKAFIIASIQSRMEAKKKEMAEMKRAARRG